MGKDHLTTLEAKKQSPVAADDALTRALRGKQGRITRADAVAASGLPVPMVEESLERLLKRFRSHLDVTEEGDLLYTFDPSFRRRDQPTLAERARSLGRSAARIGKWIFKAWITVTLITYVVAFVLLILGIMLGGAARDGDSDRRDRDRGFGLDLGWLWWFFLPDWGPMGQRDPWGRQRRVDSRRGPRKKLLQSVYDFVFGPTPPPTDALADEREALAYLRAHDARIAATDLVALFGWGYQRAEDEVTRLMVDYDGEPTVTDEGVIVYEFPKLLKSTEAVPAKGSWRMAWQRLEERPVLSANGAGTDVAIGAFACFNLVVSLFAAGWGRRYYGLSGPTWDFWLTGFPLSFFALFLAVPAFRALGRRLGDAGREARNRQRLLLQEIVNRRGGSLADGEAMDELAVALDGEPFADADGVMRYRFPRVGLELAEVAACRARAGVAAERRVGEVVFSGADESELPGTEDGPRGPRDPRRLPS